MKYFKAFLFLLVGIHLFHCSDTPTSLRVHLVYEKSWSLDRIDLSIADLSNELEITPELAVLLPEELAGKLQTLSVSAFQAEERFAYGETEVIPLRGEEVQVTVTLTRLPCGAWCAEGEKKCRADGVVVCEQRDDDHCFEWSESVPCPNEAPYCSLGQCSSECVDECAEGEQRCVGPQALQHCGQGDSDSCLEWLDAVQCADSESCSAGTCRSECIDECTLGNVECSGAGLRECADLNVDGCLEWGPSRRCPEGESCDDGSCTPIEECSDECSRSDCAGIVYHECGQFDLDPCRDRSPGTSCVPSNLCLEGSCSIEGCTQAAKICSEPSDPICISSNTLRVFDAEGSCSAGECTYTSRDIDCPNCTVVAGEPNCDACRTVVCNDPPTPQVCYQPSGTCVEGSCDYEYAEETSCDDGDACTHNDICKTGVCAGTAVTCDVIPDPICADEDTLHSFNPGGTCSGGECMYPHDVTHCESGCSNEGGAHCINNCGDRCEPQAFASSQNRPFHITLDEEYVYWTNLWGDQVMKRLKAGGDIEIVAEDQNAANRVVVDETHIYWMTGSFARVMRRAKSGGEIEVIASERFSPQGLVVDDTHIYWATHSRIRRQPKLGGEREIIVQDQNSIRALAFDNEFIYWVDDEGGQVARWAKSGGDVEVIASDQDEPVSIAVDETHVYWTNYRGGQVMRWSKSNGDIETVETTQGGPQGIALDDTHVYWVSFDGARIKRWPKSGGADEAIARLQDGPWDIALDETHIYWTNFDDFRLNLTDSNHNQVMRLSRCACDL